MCMVELAPGPDVNLDTGAGAPDFPLLVRSSIMSMGSPVLTSSEEEEEPLLAEVRASSWDASLEHDPTPDASLKETNKEEQKEEELQKDKELQGGQDDDDDAKSSVAAANLLSVHKAWPDSYVAEALYRCLCKLALIYHAGDSPGLEWSVVGQETYALLIKSCIVDCAAGATGGANLTLDFTTQQPTVEEIARHRLRPLVDKVMAILRKPIRVDFTTMMADMASNITVGGVAGGVAGGFTGGMAGIASVAAQKTVASLVTAFCPILGVGIFLGMAAGTVYSAYSSYTSYIESTPDASFANYIESSLPRLPGVFTERVIDDYNLILLFMMPPSSPSSSLKLPAAAAAAPDSSEAQEPAALDLKSVTQQLEKQIFKYVERNPSVLEPAMASATTSAITGSAYLAVDENKKDLMRRMRLLHHICRADELLRYVKVVLVMGPENAGKTTLVKCILQQHTQDGEQSSEDEDPGHLVHTNQLKVYRTRSGAVLVDCPGTEAPGCRDANASTSAWLSLERTPDLCFVVVRFEGDTNERAERLPELAREHLCDNRVLVVNQVDGVLSGTPRASVWKEYSAAKMDSLKDQFAGVAGVSKKNVLMTVLRHEDELFQESKNMFRDRGVLLQNQATQLFNRFIDESPPRLV